MINARPLIEYRIRTEVCEFKEVAGASDLDSILQGRLTDGGCYVFQDSDIQDKNESVSSVIQQFNEFFSVVFVVRNVKDMRGGDASDYCFEYRNKVMQALVGFIPDNNFEPLQKTSGKLIKFIGGMYIWKDTYKTAQYIQST